MDDVEPRIASGLSSGKDAALTDMALAEDLPAKRDFLGSVSETLYPPHRRFDCHSKGLDPPIPEPEEDLLRSKIRN